MKRTASSIAFAFFIAGMFPLSADPSLALDPSGLRGLYRSITRPDSGIHPNPGTKASESPEKWRAPEPGLEGPEPEIPAPKSIIKKTPGKNREPIPGPAEDKKEAPERLPAREQAKALVAASLTESAPGIATKNRPLKYEMPDYYQGIYLNNFVIRKSSRYLPLLKASAHHGINVLVVDVQPQIPSGEFLKKAREMGFYLVARVVVFPGGLKKYPASAEHIDGIIAVSKKSARAGFMEIQLDYIRFADRVSGIQLPLNKRYGYISKIIQQVTRAIHEDGVYAGADVFGRIPFNHNDRIGQKLEVFAKHLDTLYPMLYPSHFYGQPERIRDPYGTIYNGVQNSIKRIGHQAKVIAYIQGFNMKLAPSKLSLVEYIQKQLEASRKSGGGGFVVWNASNSYGPFFRAMKLDAKKSGIAPRRLKEGKDRWISLKRFSEAPGIPSVQDVVPGKKP